MYKYKENKDLLLEQKQTNSEKMNSIVNLMGKYDHRQHELSDWLAELEQRFQLGQVEANRAKITWCQLLLAPRVAVSSPA